MSQTIISPLVYSPDEYNLAAMLTPQSLGKVIEIQNQLIAKLGDVIWLTPSQCLHMTLMEIICDTEYKDLSRAQHFEEWYQQYGQITKEVIASFTQFELSYGELQVSASAIILKANDPTSCNKIRNTLLAKITLPEDTKIPPNIAHCTIARYDKSIDLNKVQEAVKSIEVNFNERVTEFKLMKDLVPPAFAPKCIETYLLANLP